jgi:hypothetical protein
MYNLLKPIKILKEKLCTLCTWNLGPFFSSVLLSFVFMLSIKILIVYLPIPQFITLQYIPQTIYLSWCHNKNLFTAVSALHLSMGCGGGGALGGTQWGGGDCLHVGFLYFPTFNMTNYPTINFSQTSCPQTLSYVPYHTIIKK